MLLILYVKRYFQDEAIKKFQARSRMNAAKFGCEDSSDTEGEEMDEEECEDDSEEIEEDECSDDSDMYESDCAESDGSHFEIEDY